MRTLLFFAIHVTFLGQSFANIAHRCLLENETVVDWETSEVTWSKEGLYWKTYPFSQSEAKERNISKRRCKEKNPLLSRVTSICENQEQSAKCERLQSYACEFRAYVIDQFDRPGRSRVETISAGNVAFSETRDKSSSIAKWFKDFCPEAVERRLFGIPTSSAPQGFCEEAASTLECWSSN